MASSRCPVPSAPFATASSKVVAVIPVGSEGSDSVRRSVPDRFRSGIRGTIPYRLYSALEMGCALSVAVARVIPLPAAGRARSSRRRPMPLACSSGRTNSIDRNQCDWRTTGRDEPNDAFRGGFAFGRLRSDGDQEPIRVGGLRVPVEGGDPVRIERPLGLIEPPEVVVERRVPDVGTVLEFVRSDRSDLRDLHPPPDRSAADSLELSTARVGSSVTRRSRRRRWSAPARPA